MTNTTSATLRPLLRRAETLKPQEVKSLLATFPQNTGFDQSAVDRGLRRLAFNWDSWNQDSDARNEVADTCKKIIAAETPGIEISCHPEIRNWDKIRDAATELLTRIYPESIITQTSFSLQLTPAAA